jgi:hypothetical protein
VSNKSEQRILRGFGIKPHSNSGRGWVNKSDGSDETFVWDVKEASKSFQLNKRVWDKVCSDAYHNDPYKYPGLFIVLEGNTELALIEMSVLQDLIKDIKDVRDALNELKQRDNT